MKWKQWRNGTSAINGETFRVFDSVTNSAERFTAKRRIRDNVAAISPTSRSLNKRH